MSSLVVPEPFPYPEIQDVDQVNELKDVLCFVVKAYPLKGYSLVISREKGDVGIKVTDFAGKVIDKDQYDENVTRLLGDIFPKILCVMRYARIPKGQFYFPASELRLVDIRVSSNKFCSPGFIEDIFGRAKITIQETIDKPIVLSPDNLSLIKKGQGVYEGSLILKPAVFKSIIRGDNILPLYGRIR